MDEFLRAAIAEAERGPAEGGIPIGSVLSNRDRFCALSASASLFPILELIVRSRG